VRLAERIRTAPPYPFAALSQTMLAMQRQGRRVISLGVGDPDTPPPPEAFAALRAHLDGVGMHRYPDYAGAPAFRRALAAYYRRRYGVTLDPEQEVVGLIGSKEGIAHLLWALVDPGDVVLLPDPAYPVYAVQTRFAGGEPVHLPLRAERGFLPDLDAIPDPILARARVLVLCYPNAPTAALAPPAFWRETLAFARRHGLVVVNDAAYLDIVLEGERAHSLLEFAGPDDLAVEFYSLSKTFHMTGWRLAAALGSAAVLDGLRAMKENTDSGQWTPLQLAGAALLEDPALEAYVAAENARLRTRRDRLVAALAGVGVVALPPRATLYLWTPVPGGDDAAFAQRVLEERAVLVTPGRAFGSAGRGYVRLSLSVPDGELDEACERLAGALDPGGGAPTRG
jgi:LL-diaminopimelate aminotransferase